MNLIVQKNNIKYHVMKNCIFTLASIVTLLSISVCAISQNNIKIELPKVNNQTIKTASRLVRGIDAIPKRGTPSEIIVFGKKAFPFLVDAKGRCLMAYADYGKGCAVAMGNGSWFTNSAILTNKNIAKLIDNCIDLSKQPKHNILVLHTKNLSDYLSTKYKSTGVNNLPQSLDAYDIIFCAIPTRGESYFDDNEVAQLKTWIKNGGVFVGASSGWVFKSYGPGKRGADIKTDFAANKLFTPMGINFGVRYGKGSSYPVQKVSASNAKLANSHQFIVIQNALNRINKNYIYTDAKKAVKANKLLFNRLNKISDIDLVLSKKDAENILYMVKKEQIFPTKTKQISILNARQSNLIILSDWILRSGKYKDTDFRIIAANYPGISPDISAVDKIVSIDCSESKWHSTGLWINPFETLTVKIPEEAVSKGLKIQIGCHKDNMIRSKRKHWKRWPNITYNAPLKNTENTIFSPYGGLVYIYVPKNISGKYQIEINGATPSPLYILGKTTSEDWQNQLAHSHAPWGEIEGKYCVITTELSSLQKTGYNPAEIAKFWDKLVEVTIELASRPAKKHKERYVIDCQITAGSMHSGYPIMTCESAINYKDFVLGFDSKRGKLLEDGCWGHFHELGHNHQNRDWTYAGSGEVTVNIYTLYAMEKMVGIKVREHKSIQRAQKRLDEFRKRGASFKEMQKDLIVALLMYVELQEAFGWDSYKKVFAVYNSLPKSERPKNDAQKRDQWVLRYSQAVGYNLTPFFDSWKFPYNKKIKKELAHLPVWK